MHVKTSRQTRHTAIIISPKLEIFQPQPRTQFGNGLITSRRTIRTNVECGLMEAAQYQHEMICVYKGSGPLFVPTEHYHGLFTHARMHTRAHTHTKKTLLYWQMMGGQTNNVLASPIQAASVPLINRNWFKLDEDTQAQTDKRVNMHRQKRLVDMRKCSFFYTRWQ